MYSGCVYQRHVGTFCTSGCQVHFVYVLPKWSITSKTANQRAKILAPIGVCSMHMDPLDLGCVKVIFRSFAALFSNWAVT